jgi:hypothetical protein
LIKILAYPKDFKLTLLEVPNFNPRIYYNEQAYKAMYRIKVYPDDLKQKNIMEYKILQTKLKERKIKNLKDNNNLFNKIKRIKI